MNRDRNASLKILIASLLWSCWALVLRASEIDSALATFWVFFVTWCVGVVGLKMRHIDTHRWIVASGVCNGLNTLFYFLAIQHTTASVAVLCHYLAPCLVTLIAPVWFKEKPAKLGGLYAMVSLSGIALLLEPWRSDENVGLEDHAFHGVHGGVIFALLSAVFYALTVITQKEATRSEAHATSPLKIVTQSNFWSACIATIGVMTASMQHTEPFGSRVTHGSLQGWVWVTLGALGINVLGSWLFVSGMKKVKPELAAMLACVEPLGAVMLSVFVLGEPWRWAMLAGGVLIMAAALLSIRAHSASISTSTGPTDEWRLKKRWPVLGEAPARERSDLRAGRGAKSVDDI